MTKRITEGAASGALERAEYRCGLVSLTRGRCAGAVHTDPHDPSLPLHHITYRSHGGGHESENLLPICPGCHRSIHKEAKPFYHGPYTDKKGRRYYTTDIGDRHEVRKDRLYFWEDIAEDLVTRASMLDASFQSNYRRESLARIDMARDLAEMERFALFSLTNGEPENANEYCAMLGIKSPSTVRAFLAAGSFLLDNPEEYGRITAYNEECEPGAEFTYSMLRDATGTLRRLPAHDRAVAITGMMAERMTGASGAECVDAFRDLSPQGREFRVSAKLQATDATLTLDLPARDTEGAKLAFRRKLGLLGALNGIVEARFTKVREI